MEIKIDGLVTLAGIGNGNPQSLNSFKSNSVELFYGKAMVIVKSGNSIGESEIRTTSNGLKDSQVRIKTDYSF